MSEEATGTSDVQQTSGSQWGREPTLTGSGGGQVSQGAKQPVDLKDLLPPDLIPVLDKERELLQKSRSELTDLLKQGVTVEDKVLADWGAASNLAPSNPSLEDFPGSEIDRAKQWLGETQEEKQDVLEDLKKKQTQLKDEIRILEELAKNQTAKINNLIARLKALPKQRDDLKKLVEKLEGELENENTPAALKEQIKADLAEAKAALSALDTDEANDSTSIATALGRWRELRKLLRDKVKSESKTVLSLETVAYEIDKANKDLEYIKKYESAILNKYLRKP